ncbi:signaling lymphocytic activation molecule-like isoform X2 [Scyliorhinus canicula]|uniref:signaling lymphocytic activation molecule-like isoform X2 n=1 Tax=Scyliorhinus canicula TaxID=7830 RepID=UPI0018F4B16F|nr:signaling lymphocytic activation molecule-like isoform X2 [Scyliorhinus canicula]
MLLPFCSVSKCDNGVWIGTVIRPTKNMLKHEISAKTFIFRVFLGLLTERGGLGQVDGNPSSLQRLVNGTRGQSLKLSLHLPWADPLMVSWDFRNSSTGGKIQVCSKAKHNPVIFNNEFGQRIQLNLTDYSLEIQTLQRSDQGLYEVSARSVQGVYEEKMELRVYERVSSPSIQINNVSSNGICNVSLSCLLENNSDLSYSWWRESEVVNGRTLEMTLDLHAIKTVYNCTVRNPISEETVSINLAGPCNIKDTTTTANKQLHIGLTVAVITIFIIIVIAIVMWRKNKLKTNEAPNTEGTSEPVQYAVIKRPGNAREQSQGHLCQLDANERQQSRGVQLTTIYDEIKFNPDVSTPMMVMQKGQEASANA